MSLFQDLRFAVRLLLKDRWFTAMAGIVLALGIGANNAVFTIVNGVLIRGLPFDKPDQIMMVLTRNARAQNMGISIADFEDWRAATRTFSYLSFIFAGSFNVSDDEGGVPEQYSGSYVSAGFFKMLRVTPVLGRDFGPDEERLDSAPVVMLGSSVWKQRYGSDPSILGRPLRLNGMTATIIGVMPEGVKFPFEAEIWVPASQLSMALRQAPRQSRGYFAIGRLADGVTVEQARAELKNIGDELASRYPDTNKDLTPYANPFVQQMLGPQIRLLFWSLLGAVGFVLLIACSNAANLFLARAGRRTNEISVRVALGASRWQIIRQLLIESVLLALLAGAFGLLLSMWGIRWFDAQIEGVGRPSWMVFTMDWRTMTFFLAVCLGTGLLFGLAPALQVSRTNVNEILKEGGRTGSGGVRARWWTGAIMVAELALTLVLLAGAGFMMRSFLTMYRMDIGISTSQLLAMQMILPVRKYPSIEDRATFLRRVEEHLSSVSDIVSASTTTNAPFASGSVRQLEIDGRSSPAEQRPTVTMLSVGSRYFETVGVRLVQGRGFTEVDGAPGREAVIINQRFASLYFSGEDPIDRRIRLVLDTPGADARWATIVGVVPNVRQRNNNQEAEPDAVAYIPHLQDTTMTRGSLILARTRANPAQAAQALREGIRAVDPDMALFNLQTVDEILAQQRWLLRVFSTMFAAFAAMALVLAAVGLYAVTAYSVMQYTRDIGLRMVLGARSVEVIWLFLRRAFVQLGIGLLIGLVASLAAGRLLQGLLVQTSPYDPLTLVSIVALLTVVSVVACTWPAWRATRLDPLAALRHE